MPRFRRFRYLVLAIIIVGVVSLYLMLGHNNFVANTNVKSYFSTILPTTPYRPIPALVKQIKKESVQCNFPVPIKSKHTDIDMEDIYYNLSFIPQGEHSLWDEQFEINFTRKTETWKGLPLKVFVIPHSHSDPGWLKTVMDYFSDQTKHTLDNMLTKLLQYPDMTFIWAEMSFFNIWWMNLDAFKKEQVKKLITRGQLELVTGGWVMTDEATAHYHAIIDQLIEGHQWIINNLGILPKNAWSVDPFGHSGTIPYLLQKSHLEHMVVQRIHYTVKKFLAQNEALEFLWRQEWDAGQYHTDILCHMMPFYIYTIKHTCGPDPLICLEFDFRKIFGEMSESRAVRIDDSNVNSKAQLLLTEYRKKASLFKHNVVLVPLGDDFRYDKIEEWDQQYLNYKKLFDYMNSRQDWHVEARFGTLADYFNAVEERMPSEKPKKHFPVLKGDFFTYADKYTDYWSGYYTSRPYYKGMCRELESRLRSAEILYTLATAGKLFDETQILENFRLLLQARINLGLFLHHDAITGTSKDFVMRDYGEKLYHGLQVSGKVLANSASKILLEKANVSRASNVYVFPAFERLEFQQLPSPFIFDVLSGEQQIIIFNSLAHQRQDSIHLSVNTPSVNVLDDKDNVLPSQINPIWINEGQISYEQYELIIFVDIPPLSLQVFTLRREIGSVKNLASISIQNDTRSQKILKFPLNKLKNEIITFENSHLLAQFSPQTGYLEAVTLKSSNLKIKSYLELQLYQTWKGGAYIFKPEGPAINVSSPFQSRYPIVQVIQGILCSEIRVSFPNFIHTVRLYHTNSPLGMTLHIQDLVDMSGLGNKEAILKLTTNIKNGNVFYTDLNGFQIAKRKIIHDLPIEANYYPITTMAYIEDSNVRVTMHVSQAHGMGTMSEGSMEIMLDRQLLQDDFHGLAEGVTDNRHTSFNMKLHFEQRMSLQAKDLYSRYPSLASHYHNLALNYPMDILVVKQPQGQKILTSFEPLQAPFPCDVHLLNLRSLAVNGNALSPSKSAAFLIHRLGYNCNFPQSYLKCDVYKNEMKLHSTFKSNVLPITTLKEMSLTLLHEIRKLDTNNLFELLPMEVYSFNVTFQ